MFGKKGLQKSMLNCTKIPNTKEYKSRSEYSRQHNVQNQMDVNHISEVAHSRCGMHVFPQTPRSPFPRRRWQRTRPLENFPNPVSVCSLLRHSASVRTATTPSYCNGRAQERASEIICSGVRHLVISTISTVSTQDAGARARTHAVCGMAIVDVWLVALATANTPS